MVRVRESTKKKTKKKRRLETSGPLLPALPHDAVVKEGGVTMAWQGAVIVAAAGVSYMMASEPTAATGAPGRWFGGSTKTGQKR